MSPILSPMTKSSREHLGPWRWSKCSAAKIRQSFNIGRGNCLYKRQVMVRNLMPIVVEKTPPENPVTDNISEHKQCQLIFGKGTKKYEKTVLFQSYGKDLEKIGYTPCAFFFDSPFSNFCQKKAPCQKKGTTSKKGIFGTKFVISVKKRHSKKTFLVTNLSPICQSFIENYMTIKKRISDQFVSLCTKDCLFYFLFFCQFFDKCWCLFFYFLAKFFTKLRKGVVKVPFLRSQWKNSM